MNCADVQDVIYELDRGPNETPKRPPFGLSVEEIDLALHHMDDCADCKMWFSEDRCPKMVGVTDSLTLGNHKMFHEDYIIPDCKTSS